MQIDSKSGFLIRSAIVLLVGALFYSTVTSQEPDLPDNPLRGARIFQQKGCIKCHAIRGEGGDTAPDLGKEQFHGGFLELACLMWNHFPEMKSAIRQLGGEIPVFTRHEMEDLFAYLFYVPYLGEPGDEKLGRKLLKEKGCLKCHGESGRKMTSAPDLKKMKFFGSPLYLAQAMWNHGPKMQQQMVELGIKRPRLTGEEMTNLAAYLQSVSSGGLREKVYMQPGNPKSGSKLFKTKHCTDCHSTDAMPFGKRSAPDLSRSKKFTTVTRIAGTMWNHGGEMMLGMMELGIPWPRFSGEEMSDLIAYIYFLRFNDPPGESQSGEEVFKAKNCSRCHNLPEEPLLRGQRRIPPVESPMTLVMLMWNHATRMDSLMNVVKIDWPEFNLEEMTDLYAFLKLKTDKRDEE